jgi:hypothetical protein
MRMVSKDRLTVARPLWRVAAILHGTTAWAQRSDRRKLVILDMKRVVIEFEYREIVPLEDAVGTRIDCLRGRIWITEWRSTDDIVLEPGQWYVISRGGVALVQALREALVRFRAPAVHQSGGRLATCAEWLWNQWAARGACGQYAAPGQAGGG